ncbi:MAG: hypothetical protein GY847_27410 [Proteobacteria bacterium]|nr:hypothetical protein [Pseudomonadota bacterium]
MTAKDNPRTVCNRCTSLALVELNKENLCALCLLQSLSDSKDIELLNKIIPLDLTISEFIDTFAGRHK